MTMVEFLFLIVNCYTKRGRLLPQIKLCLCHIRINDRKGGGNVLCINLAKSQDKVREIREEFRIRSHINTNTTKLVLLKLFKISEDYFCFVGWKLFVLKNFGGGGFEMEYMLQRVTTINIILFLEFPTF